jgi:LysM repeat protein
MDKTTTSDDGWELRSLLSNSNRKESFSSEPQVEYTYYDIQPGDSLQGICLRYACSVNQVRRMNRLMTDQDFYGLRRLKLPLGKFGLLEELLRQQTDLLLFENNNQTHTRHKSSPGSALSVTTRPKRDYPSNDISIAINTDPKQITVDDMLIIKNVFEDLDHHVERAKAAAADYEKRAADIVEEIDITSDNRHSCRVSKIPELFFSGENFGLNLKKLLILMFVVCLVIPLVYMQQAHIM